MLGRHPHPSDKLAEPLVVRYQSGGRDAHRLHNVAVEQLGLASYVLPGGKLLGLLKCQPLSSCDDLCHRWLFHEGREEVSSLFNFSVELRCPPL